MLCVQPLRFLCFLVGSIHNIKPQSIGYDPYDLCFASSLSDFSTFWWQGSTALRPKTLGIAPPIYVFHPASPSSLLLGGKDP